MKKKLSYDQGRKSLLKKNVFYLKFQKLLQQDCLLLFNIRQKKV